MNEAGKSEMTKEELQKIIDEYRDKNVQLEAKLNALEKQLEMAWNYENLYRATISNLSSALRFLAEAMKEKA